MAFDAALLYSFLLVFIRCSAMLLVSPIFGAQNTPVQVRVFTTLAIAGALTCALKPAIGPVPADTYVLVGAVIKEALAGMLIGVFMSLILQAAQMGGAIIDMQMGLGMSQALNPLTGVPVTVISQFKFLLALVLFLTMNCHHQMIIAFARSYEAMPALSYDALPAVRDGIVTLITQLSLLALQMAAPVLAVSMIVDAGLAIVSKAVPQMQAMLVGLPAKVIMGMLILSVGLPALAGGISTGVGVALKTMSHATGMK
jgi:flagellar biosynthetic protein FliR